MSDRLRNFHRTPNRFPDLSEEDNFLKNLGLSQDRAFQASKFLIEKIQTKVNSKAKSFQLRELMIAQGKSYLEPVFKSEGIEDLDRSKRLEFKIILGGSDGI